MSASRFDQLVTTCVGASQEEVHAYDHEARSVTEGTALRRIGAKALAQAFPDYVWGSGTAGGLRLRDDWAVKYSAGWFRGHKCITVHHSRIHYFFIQEPQT